MRSITLRNNDSINLTTGEVTRSAPTGEYMPGYRMGLRANDPISFHSALVCLALRGKIQMSINTRDYANRCLSN